jgi:hypothetical protein
MGLQVENVLMHEQTNYPLTIVIGSAEKISISFEYNATLVEEQYVQNIRDHFEHVLLQITGGVLNEFREIKLLTEVQEQHYYKTSTTQKSIIQKIKR